jgi:hypothetical protein
MGKENSEDRVQKSHHSLLKSTLLQRAEFLAKLRKSKKINKNDLKETKTPKKLVNKMKRPNKLKDQHRASKPQVSEIARKIMSSTWEGISDDEGSVDSAILDENICYECGKKTHRETEFDTLILCDECDAEYHLACVGRDCILTRKSNFTCPRCVEDKIKFRDLNFLINSHDPRFIVSS